MLSESSVNRPATVAFPGVPKVASNNSTVNWPPFPNSNSEGPPHSTCPHPPALMQHDVKGAIKPKGEPPTAEPKAPAGSVKSNSTEIGKCSVSSPKSDRK